MKITDLFKQDILNPKPILIKEYGGTTERPSSINSEAILLTLLFGLTVILVTSKQITNGTSRKEN
ncbi:MAG: hypothetical protein KBC58_03585 [Flavobacterium sp.]|jgi:hypothetical protein|nr:hypothetical protein [Flavobacterium sp.]